MQSTHTLRRAARHRLRPAADRRGSTIIVVIALLSALMLLGFFFFSLAAQENENAEYFKDTAKNLTPLELDPDQLFDHFLKQFILGADDASYNSMFWGGRNSLLPTMFGTDRSPFNGEGVNATWSDYGNPQNGYPVVDLNYDALADGAMYDYMLELNQSPGAQLAAGSDANTLDLVNDPARWLPDPDVPYTYFDHTSPFLAYIGYVPSAGGPKFVVLPSFTRPQLLRNRPGVGSTPTDWETDPATVGFVLRAHRERLAVAENGIVTSERRYRPDYFTSVGTPVEGMWEGLDGLPANYDYDVDPAGLGYNSAVYLDTDFPLQVDPTTGEQFVVKFGVVVLDAESLLNLNLVGNTALAKINGTAPLNAISDTNFLSRSNEGASRSEINPLWAMLADPFNENSGAFSFADYQQYFGVASVLSDMHAANMDLWALFHGRPRFSGAAISEVYPGRYGEAELTDAAWTNGMPVGAYPWAGLSGTDDNFNESLDRAILGAYGTYPYGPRPFDRFGVGNRALGPGGNSRYRRRVNDEPANPAFGRIQYPIYSGYALNALPYAINFGGTLMPGVQATPILDEPNEALVDPNLASNFGTDLPFEASDNAFLQLSTADRVNAGVFSRLEELARWTMVENDRNERIRRRTTTVSHKLKTHSRTLYDNAVPALMPFHNRFWEWNDTDGDGNLNFPPTTGAVPVNDPRQPIRPALRELMLSEEGDASVATIQRKLNVNGVLDYDSNGLLRQRSLTPHSMGIGPGAITIGAVMPENVPGGVTKPGTSASQEFLARYDRQRLARDIYTMLYVFCHGDSTLNTLTTQNTQATGWLVYSPEECRAMAQFAVNLVDALDDDDVITVFEYDMNLANGWGLDDYPYTTAGDFTADYNPVTGLGERRVVYGVEEQQLTLSEGLAMYTEIVRNGIGMATDHPGTEWNDAQRYQFLFLEMQNMSTRDVTLENNSWQVVVRPVGWTGAYVATNPPDFVGSERRLTLRADAAGISTVGIGNNSFVSMGTAAVLEAGTVGPPVNTAGDFPAGSSGAPVAPADGPGGALGPARILVRQDATSTGTPITVAPFTANVDDLNYIDLLRDTSQFFLHDAPATPDAFEDGAPINTGNYGAEFIDLPVPAPGTTYKIEVSLRRRANPYRIAATQIDPAESADNPWVVVDRMLVDVRNFNLDETSDGQAELQAALQGALSNSRFQPLYGNPNDSLGNTAWDNTTYRTNTIGGNNENSAARFTLWHPHNNRESASLADVFNVPYCGPDRLNDPEAPEAPVDLNSGLGPWRGLTTRLGENTSGDPRDARLVGRDTFGFLALNPWGPDGDPATIGDNNNWYRLLEFVEVPSGIHQNMVPDGSNYLEPGINPVNGARFAATGAYSFCELIGNYGGYQTRFYRDPGPLNPNTLREPENLAAWLDDDQAIQRPVFGQYNGPLTPLTDISGSGRGDWWNDFIESRDGTGDPIATAFGAVALPGVPGISRPFRPLDFHARQAFYNGATGQVQHSIEDTLLRTLSAEHGVSSPLTPRGRQLFELGSIGDHNTYPENSDYAYKYRLLSKILNHSTTTSNTFFVFLQADYFEAEQVTVGGNTVVRIGQKLPSSPGYRGFFVVDRSKALEMVQQEHVPNKNGARTFSFNQSFDWRSLVLHRLRLN